MALIPPSCIRPLAGESSGSVGLVGLSVRSVLIGVAMKVAYRWLKELVDFDLSPSDLGEALTMMGLEAVSIENLEAALQGVVVGRVEEVRPHPNADRLSVCRVDVGTHVLEIVCGAPNVQKGQKVPVATVGTTLPNGQTIQRIVVRGVASAGMICSEVELGLGTDASGILVLSDEVAPAGTIEIGAPLAEALGLDDTVIELELTSNRPDCMSMVGVAREIGAIVGCPVRMPKIDVIEDDVPVEAWISVDIEDPKGCPRYAARVIRGVQVGPSPVWMQRRLEQVGLRPINNVVDVTNYVLMELGHPLHAFDLDRLTDRRIVVRRAKKGEALTTLDDVERTLDEQILVIADAVRPVAIAGVMGGGNSEVSDQTTDLLLESAYFDPMVIRRGAKQLGMSTEASQRFERGMDWDGVIRAIDRAAQLIREVAGGAVARGILDVFPRPFQRTVVSFRPERVNRILGTDLSGEAMGEMLGQLGCTVSERDGKLEVETPSFRPDLSREIDLVEEVARVYGYNAIESREVGGGSLWVERKASDRLIASTREALTGLGLYEVVTSSFTDPDLCQGEPIRVSNASHRGVSALRTDLLPGLLEVARWNINRKMETVEVFEIGAVFPPGEPEELQIAALVAGVTHSGWDRSARAFDFYDLKGILESYVEGVLGEHIQYRPVVVGHPAYEEERVAELRCQGQPVGFYGQVRGDLCAQFDLERPVYSFCLRAPNLLSAFDQSRMFVPLPRYPAVERDLAVIVPEDVEWGQILEAVLSVDRTLIESVELFDVYRGKPVPAGEKSLAFSVRLRSSEGTLSEEQAGTVYDRMVARLSEAFGARLRAQGIAKR